MMLSQMTEIIPSDEYGHIGVTVALCLNSFLLRKVLFILKNTVFVSVTVLVPCKQILTLKSACIVSLDSGPRIWLLFFHGDCTNK